MLNPFIAALAANGIKLVADVRRLPSSRRFPHFSESRLAPALKDLTIDYVHVPELGGHREPRTDSPNTAIRDPIFRAYADHMATPEFARGISRVLEAAAARPVAVMCAERKWTECHRQFIADHLKALGHDVVHIFSEDTAEPHEYTKFARIEDGKLSYRGLI